MAALFPYLSVYLKELGITPDEVALLGAFTPLIALVTRPAFALLADKTGFHKLVRTFSSYSTKLKTICIYFFHLSLLSDLDFFRLLFFKF